MKLYYEKSELPVATTLAESTIDEEIRQGRFPKPRQLAGRRVGYLVREVNEWAESRPPADQAPPANTGAKKPRATGAAAPAAPAVRQAA